MTQLHAASRAATAGSRSAAISSRAGSSEVVARLWTVASIPFNVGTSASQVEVTCLIMSTANGDVMNQPIAARMRRRKSMTQKHLAAHIVAEVLAAQAAVITS